MKKYDCPDCLMFDSEASVNINFCAFCKRKYNYQWNQWYIPSQWPQDNQKGGTSDAPPSITTHYTTGDIPG
jgi:hypothetical protein